jgi:hypothetical protein
VAIEKPSGNMRILRASIDIAAPPAALWRCLTDYDGLGDFVPSLAVNQCLERVPRGCRLLQVGEQDVAFGVKFSARCIMEITEFPQGFPGAAASPTPAGALGTRLDDIPEAAGLPGAPCQDITFVLVEGDFQCFKGLWRIQPGTAGAGSTRLSYSVKVSPMAWLPVGLITGRIEREISANLKAVAAHAEGMGSSAA